MGFRRLSCLRHALILVLVVLAAGRVTNLRKAMRALQRKAFDECVGLLADVGRKASAEHLGVLAVCEMRAGKVADGIERFATAMDLGWRFAEVLDVYPNLPKDLEHFSKQLYQKAGAYDLSLDARLLALRADIRLQQASRSKHPERPRDQLSIVIFAHLDNTGNSIGWGPHSIASGIGGSEEAVILLSRELVQLGAWVEVYGDIPESDAGVDAHGVMWRPWQSYDGTAPCNVFVAWRRIEAALLCSACDQVYIWFHDGLSWPQLLTPPLVEYLGKGQRYKNLSPLKAGGFFVLSKYHKRLLPQHARGIAKITRNGLSGPSLTGDFGDHGQMNQTSQRCNTCGIYASSPMRGLAVLLQYWPWIRQMVPNATLEVYYGFPSYLQVALNQSAEMRQYKERLERALQQDGISYLGMVGQEELARANARAGFYLYPTSYMEVSCISLMRAQALGAIPITSRHLNSALPETAGRWDLGPTSALEWWDSQAEEVRAGYKDMDNNVTLQKEWAEVVVNAMRIPSETLEQYRKNMTQWAREHFSWQGVAQQWMAWFAKEFKIPEGERHSDDVPPKLAARPSLYIPWIAYGGTANVHNALSMMKLLVLLKDANMTVNLEPITGESLIPRARNIAAAKFLSSRMSHMLFADADITFDAENVLHMMHVGRDVVTGAYRLKTDEPRWAFNGNWTASETPGLYRVDWPTTGFMLIRREALEKIAAEMPDRKYKNNVPGYGITDVYDYFPVGIDDETGMYLSEDFGFAALCRKSQVDMFLYGNATLGHIGAKAYVGNFHQSITMEAELR